MCIHNRSFVFTQITVACSGRDCQLCWNFHTPKKLYSAIPVEKINISSIQPLCRNSEIRRPLVSIRQPANPYHSMKKKLKDLLVKAYRMFCMWSLIFRDHDYSGKIFCIGFNKTGTTSCGKAIEKLGFFHSSFNRKVWRKYYHNNQMVKLLKYTAKFESFDDLPWLKEDMIPVLDKVFPGSKFIYLTRDEASWKQSMKNWTYKMTGEYPDMEEKLRQFRAHKEFVLNYFADRSEDHFLVLDVREEGAYEKLGRFLGKETPQRNFPHFNKTALTHS